MRKFNLIQNTLDGEDGQPPVLCQVEKEVNNGKQLVNMRCS
jgi:hypothetical protein